MKDRPAGDTYGVHWHVCVTGCAQSLVNWKSGSFRPRSVGVTQEALRHPSVPPKLLWPCTPPPHPQIRPLPHLPQRKENETFIVQQKQHQKTIIVLITCCRGTRQGGCKVR